VNPYTFGRVTPGTGIRIESEGEMHERRAGYLVVFPRHLRDTIVERETECLRAGGRLILARHGDRDRRLVGRSRKC